MKQSVLYQTFKNFTFCIIYFSFILPLFSNELFTKFVFHIEVQQKKHIKNALFQIKVRFHCAKVNRLIIAFSHEIPYFMFHLHVNYLLSIESSFYLCCFFLLLLFPFAFNKYFSTKLVVNVLLFQISSLWDSSLYTRCTLLGT